MIFNSSLRKIVDISLKNPMQSKYRPLNCFVSPPPAPPPLSLPLLPPLSSNKMENGEETTSEA